MKQGALFFFWALLTLGLTLLKGIKLDHVETDGNRSTGNNRWQRRLNDFIRWSGVETVQWIFRAWQRVANWLHVCVIGAWKILIFHQTSANHDGIFTCTKRWKKFCTKMSDLTSLMMYWALTNIFRLLNMFQKKYHVWLHRKKPVPQSSIWNPLKLLKHVVGFIKVDQVVGEESRVDSSELTLQS